MLIWPCVSVDTDTKEVNSDLVLHCFLDTIVNSGLVLHCFLDTILIIYGAHIKGVSSDNLHLGYLSSPSSDSLSLYIESKTKNWYSNSFLKSSLNSQNTTITFHKWKTTIQSSAD